MPNIPSFGGGQIQLDPQVLLANLMQNIGVCEQKYPGTIQSPGHMNWVRRLEDLISGGEMMTLQGRGYSSPLVNALQQPISPTTQQFVQTPSVPFAPQGAARLPTVQPVRPIARSPWGGIGARGYQPQMGAYTPRRNPLEERLRRLRGGM